MAINNDFGGFDNKPGNKVWKMRYEAWPAGMSEFVSAPTWYEARTKFLIQHQAAGGVVTGELAPGQRSGK